jgi:hypothetical protein
MKVRRVMRVRSATREVVGAATMEAHRRGDRHLGTEHLLLGVLIDAPTVSAAGVDRETARAALYRLDRQALGAIGVDPAFVAQRTSIRRATRLPLTGGSRLALQRAAREAARLEKRRIEPRHVLFGLLVAPEPDQAALLLRYLDQDTNAIFDRLRPIGTDRH